MKNQILTSTTVDAFADCYPTNAGICNNAPLWDALKACILMPEQLNTVICANDNLAIPPAESFLRWWNNFFPWIDQDTLTAQEKRSIGLFWRYIFRDILHYKRQERLPSSIAGLRTATRYFGSPLPPSVLSVQ